jgi:hypothetical protein
MIHILDLDSLIFSYEPWVMEFETLCIVQSNEAKLEYIPIQSIAKSYLTFSGAQKIIKRSPFLKSNVNLKGLSHELDRAF